jgi:hypothetical protein
MKCAALLSEQAPVGDLVRERVFEGVIQVGEKPGFVYELGVLQVVQRATKVVFL